MGEGQRVGMATNLPTVIHEFGHGMLYSHVHSANLSFVHGPGDAMAAIYTAPYSKAEDKERGYWTL